ncbi:RNA polymerase sigma factor [Streptomyces sp. NPDC059690]|uniref:RNA polymerase sigma factor n=1 Tax=Streptomyces sp. NPDC059690 TaxID=3346907 RepID=UPI0036B6C7DE
MEDFYRERHPRLRQFVARRVVGQGEVEDVCQEIWRIFFNRFEVFRVDYDDPAQALYPIARCRIADFWKQRTGRREFLVAGEDLVELAEKVRPVVTDDGDCRLWDLQEALAALPARQREALSLRYLEDLSVRTTAAEMGVSENTVKKHVREGLSVLRALPSLTSYRSAATVTQEVAQ